MKKKPLRMNSEILRDLHRALEHVHKLMSADGRRRYGIEIDERYVAGFTEDEKTRIAPYLESWILAPLTAAIRNIERARVVVVAVELRSPDCSCSAHSGDDGASHSGLAMVSDSCSAADKWPGGDWASKYRNADEAEQHAKFRRKYYEERGYEVRIHRSKS